MLSPIIIVIIVVLLAIIFFKLLKSILKAVIIAVGLGILLLVVVMLIAYSDMKQITSSLEKGDKVLLYSYEDVLYTGILAGNATPLSIGLDGTLPVGLSSASPQDIEKYSALLLDSKSANDSFVIIVDHDWLWESLGSVEVLGVIVDEELFVMSMTSNNAKEVFEQESGVGVPEGADVKNIMFLAAFHNAMKENDAQSLLGAMRNGQIITSPKLLSVGIIKLIPDEAFSHSFKEYFSVTRFDQEEVSP